MNDTEFAALEQACEGHTPGPWLPQDADVGYGKIIAANGEAVLTGCEGLGDDHLSAYEADLALACAAPTLLAEVRRLRQELAELARLTQALREAKQRHAEAFARHQAQPEAEQHSDGVWEARRTAAGERDAREALMAYCEELAKGQD